MGNKVDWEEGLGRERGRSKKDGKAKGKKNRKGGIRVEEGKWGIKNKTEEKNIYRI